MGRALKILVVPWLCLGLFGCSFSLPNDLVKMDHPELCPELSSKQLETQAKRYTQDTDSFQLQCLLEQLRESSPLDIHATEAVSRICFWLSDRLDPKDKRREKLAAEGVRWAEIALQESNHAPGPIHYYLAVNLGLALQSHPSLALKHLGRLQSNLEKAIALAPAIDQGGPLRVLGMLYLIAPPWPRSIGDIDKALEYLERAVLEYPDHPQNQMFYAQALCEAEENLTDIAPHLQESQRLLADEKWQAVQERWLLELHQIAKDCKVELKPRSSMKRQPMDKTDIHKPSRMEQGWGPVFTSSLLPSKP